MFYTEQQHSDIPKYDKAPLPNDLSAVVRPMWSYQTTDSRGRATIHYVTYSYRQVGGLVFRHRFSFTPDTRQTIANTVRLATQIGDTRYME